MGNYNHVSLRYILDRINVWYDYKFNPEKPWLTADAIKILNELIKPSDSMLEIGSGRSTTWFAERVRTLHSIEDHPDWFNLISKKLNERKLDSKVMYQLLEIGEKYSQALSLIDDKFDIILVDGGDRGQCALKSITMLKVNGLLVVDNANWYLPSPFHSPGSFTSPNEIDDPIWRQFYDLTYDWRVIRTTNGISDTFIYICK